MLPNFVEYSGQKKPLIRNGENRNTDFKETILIVLFFAQFRMLGPRGILNLVRASHSQFSGARFPFDRYAGFHYSGFTVYFAPLYSPCFELWLLLHKVDISQFSESEKQNLLDNKRVSKSGDPLLKKRLRELMGAYSESSYDAESLMPFVQDAIKRAESLEANVKDRWPQGLGTRVYLLVKSIIDQQ